MHVSIIDDQSIYIIMNHLKVCCFNNDKDTFICLLYKICLNKEKTLLSLDYFFNLYFRFDLYFENHERK